MEAPEKQKVVLLVDDEEKVLRALSRRLKAANPNFEVLEACSAQEGLELLGKQSVDLVISDLQMPVMDGAAFLSIVRERHPNVLRFALSGHAQQEMMLRAIALSHQYFSKPCDSANLGKIIDESLKNTENLTSKKLKEIVIHLNQFPPMQPIYRELIVALADSKKELHKVIDIIDRDPAMASKVLHVANSAFFGSPHEVCDIEEAVMLLGTEAVRSLALMFNFIKGIKDPARLAISMEKLWQHSVATAGIASKILDGFYKEGESKETLRAASLLHDLGKVILADFAPGEYRMTLDNSVKNNRSLSLIEEEVFHISHASVGALLFELWGLPERLCMLIRYHHSPSHAPETVNKNLLLALHVADVLEYNPEAKNEFAPPIFDEEFLKKMGVPFEREFWRQWIISKN
jgi:putative nucleotidyltransferase with HDIG domain